MLARIKIEKEGDLLDIVQSEIVKEIIAILLFSFFSFKVPSSSAKI
jgi:hypothetical protein